MSLHDLEIRKYTAPIEKELNKQKDKNGILKSENKKLREALNFFINGYPDKQWMKLLHEEGCPGATWLPDERDELDPCKCDGDYQTEQVLEALKRGR